MDSVCPGALPRGALECELHHRVGSTGRQVGWGWSFLCPHIPGSVAVGRPWGGRSYPAPTPGKVTPPSGHGHFSSEVGPRAQNSHTHRPGVSTLQQGGSGRCTSAPGAIMGPEGSVPVGPPRRGGHGKQSWGRSPCCERGRETDRRSRPQRGCRARCEDRLMPPAQVAQPTSSVLERPPPLERNTLNCLGHCESKRSFHSAQSAE